MANHAFPVRFLFRISCASKCVNSEAVFSTFDLYLWCWFVIRTADACGGEVDVVFVIDNSDNNPNNGSWNNWEIIRDFFVHIVDFFDVSVDNARVSR